MSIKCQQCRYQEVELLTRFERIRAWLFEKMNYIFFADEFEDLKNARYTQGFSDGNVEGFKQGKIEKKLNDLQDLFPTVPYNPECETKKVDYTEAIKETYYGN